MDRLQRSNAPTLAKTLVYSARDAILLAMRTLSALLTSLLFCVSSLQAAEEIVSRDAQIDGVQLHYLTAGHAPATVILLHGFAETSRMWRPIIPLLAEKFTVI